MSEEIMKSVVAPLAGLFLLLLPVSCFADDSETQAWVKQMAASRDHREEFTKWSARVADAKSTVAAVMTWSKALEKKPGEKIDAGEVFQFVGRYDPIWKDDKYQASASEKLSGRIKYLSKADLTSWKTAFNDFHKEGVSDIWTVAFVVQMDRLFGDKGFVRTDSDLLQARLKTLPKAAGTRLVQEIGGAQLKAAITLIQADFFFTGGAFRQEVFDQTLKTLHATPGGHAKAD
jgi:hypothetical protein